MDATAAVKADIAISLLFPSDTRQYATIDKADVTIGKKSFIVQFRKKRKSICSCIIDAQALSIVRNIPSKGVTLSKAMRATNANNIKPKKRIFYFLEKNRLKVGLNLLGP
jgi:replication fork clamp-binding protein CrfC